MDGAAVTRRTRLARQSYTTAQLALDGYLRGQYHVDMAKDPARALSIAAADLACVDAAAAQLHGGRA